MDQKKALKNFELIDGEHSVQPRVENGVGAIFKVTKENVTRDLSAKEYLYAILDWYYKEAENVDAYGKLKAIVNAESHIRRVIIDNNLRIHGDDFSYIFEDIDVTFRRHEVYLLADEAKRIDEERGKTFRNTLLSGTIGTILGAIIGLLGQCQQKTPIPVVLDSPKIQIVHDTIFLNFSKKNQDTSLVRLVKSPVKQK